MRNKILIPAIAYIFIMMLTSCSKHEQIIIEPGTIKKDTGAVKVKRMFIGVHALVVNYPTDFDLIVGFTNSDGSFTKTDSVRGPFMISSNMDKHTSALSIAKQQLYFIYKHSITGNLQIGIVNSSTGKFLRTINLGISQNDMIHLQYDEQGAALYFSMARTMYQVNETNGTLSDVKLQQNAIQLPPNYSSGAGYLSHLLGSKRFLYVNNNTSLLFYDRSTQVWDSIGLPPGGSFRSLVVSPTDENILYSYDLTGNTIYNLVKINLSNKTTSIMVTQNSFCHILWFQARFHPVNKLYSCLPFDHLIFPYFITINVVTGETIKYPSPSQLGQCILD